MTKQHLNLSIDTYVLTKWKEKFGEGTNPNISAWIEAQMTLFINAEKVRRRHCRKCPCIFPITLETCPECKSFEYTEIEEFQ